MGRGTDRGGGRDRMGIRVGAGGRDRGKRTTRRITNAIILLLYDVHLRSERGAGNNASTTNTTVTGI